MCGKLVRPGALALRARVVLRQGVPHAPIGTLPGCLLRLLVVQVLDVNDQPILIGPPVGLVPENYHHRPKPFSRQLWEPIYTIPFRDDDVADTHVWQLNSGNVGTRCEARGAHLWRASLLRGCVVCPLLVCPRLDVRV